jgi:hypothetical protein
MRKIQPAIRGFVQVTLAIPESRREEAITRIFLPARQRFLDRSPGAVSMDLLVREEDVQLLHGFDTFENSRVYLDSGFFRDLIGQLGETAEKEPVTALYNVD